MNSQVCWRCLAKTSSRPEATLQPFLGRNAGPIAAFSTSSTFYANPVKAKKTITTTKKGARQTFQKKNNKADQDRSRPFGAQRKPPGKRIVLSNTNALDVPGLRYLEATNLVDESLRGQVLGIPGDTVDQLRAVDAFKFAQGWATYSRPAMLLRGETLEYAKMMEDIGQNTVRKIIVGERGTGKTTMLLQAMTIAFLKGWVVVNIPEAQKLTIGHTEYSPTSPSLPTTYAQKTYTATLLSAIARANDRILSQLTLSQPPPQSATLPSIPQNISLSRLASLGASDPETAPEIFSLLMSDLQQPNRPPLLLCIDNLAHVMRDSLYRDAAFRPIHAHQLELVKWFMGYLSGAEKLANGGVVLGAMSASNSPTVPTLKMGVEMVEQGRRLEERDPFTRWDERVLEVFERGGLEVQRMKGVTREEARGLMEYWARSGVLLDKVDERKVGEEWVGSGGGVVGELERGCVRGRVGYQI